MIVALILVPLTGAVLAYLFGGRSTARVAMATAVAVAGLTLWAIIAVWSGGPRGTSFGSWPVPLGIRLYLDGLALLMIVMASGIGVLLTLYAAFYFSRRATKEDAASFFWPLWLVLWAAMNGLFLAFDVFTIYILLEISLLSAVALTTLAGSRTSTVAALQYLLAAMTGSLAYLLGVGILYNLHGALDISALASVVEPGPATGAALLLMTAGLLVKAAVFPLHFWLPRAHASAPAPVSAVLSGVVIKGAFFILLRLWMAFSGQGISFAAGQLLGGLAVAAILWGSFQALRQKSLKMLVAYSTVAQVGFFFLLFPSLAGSMEVGGPQQPESWVGGAVQATAHALAKAALFLGAGIVILARGSDDLADMRGLVRRMPLTVIALLLAGLALYGIPSSGSDLGKKIIVDAALADGQWWWEPFVRVGGFLTIGYTIAMLRFSVLRERGDVTLRKVPVWIQCIPLPLAFGSIAFAWPQAKLLHLLMIGAR